MDRLVSTCHLQFVEKQQRREGAERLADTQAAIGRRPEIAAVVMPPGKNGVDV